MYYNPANVSQLIKRVGKLNRRIFLKDHSTGTKTEIGNNISDDIFEMSSHGICSCFYLCIIFFYNSLRAAPDLINP